MSNIQTYYHGGDSRYELWYDDLLWLTPEDYYAKQYAIEVDEPVIWEVIIDEDKLNDIALFDLDGYTRGSYFDAYKPSKKTLKLAYEDGYNCYYMEYDSFNASGLCLFFDKSPIVSVRKLTKEEYDLIDENDY